MSGVATETMGNAEEDFSPVPGHGPETTTSPCAMDDLPATTRIAMSGAEADTMSTAEEETSRSALPGVHTALRNPSLQIRLLRLHGGSKRHGISASLEVWERGSEPKYRAISYVCGDARRMQSITVNGSRVSVRYNCYYALWQTRLHFPQSRVWIDAICINQLDLDEKTAQVMMMHETYTNAMRVLTCIGPSDTHSNVVMQAVDDPDAVVQRIPENWKARPINKDVWNSPLDAAAATQFLDHYNEFSMRPYFTRVWILQELAAGRTHALLICGQRMSHWLDLVQLTRRLYVVHENGPDGPYKGHFSLRIAGIDMNVSRQLRYNFPFYLAYIRELQCQDVRDRIYSTSILVDWSSFGQRPPIPDYRISPLELALQLIGKMVDLQLDCVALIARTLGLLDPSTISPVLEELRTRRLDTRCSQGLDVIDRKWYTQLRGAQMVEQDLTGRPFVKTNYGDITWEHPSSLSVETTAASERSRPHQYDASTVEASKRARPGDFIVDSCYFQLVLRPHDDGDKFVVVSNEFPGDVVKLARRAPFAAECDCHSRLLRTADDVELEYYHIAIELSDEDALAAVIISEVRSMRRDARITSLETMSIDDYDLPGYLRSGAFGRPKIGSHVWDVTADKMEDDHSVEMGQLPCVAHRAGDYYWKHQKFLWYSVLMGTGMTLTFPRRRKIVGMMESRG